MLTPTFTTLSPDTPLSTWLHYYCRLGYEVTLACRGPQDSDPWCQRLAARRHALRQAAQQEMQRYYQLAELPAQHLFAQWSQRLFKQLLSEQAMPHIELEAALTQALPT